MKPSRTISIQTAMIIIEGSMSASQVQLKKSISNKSNQDSAKFKNCSGFQKH
jgi:hypothetical protein